MSNSGSGSAPKPELIFVTLEADRGEKYDQTGECVGSYRRSIVFLPKEVKPDEMVRVRLIPIEGKVERDGKMVTESKLDRNGRVMYRGVFAPVDLPFVCKRAIAQEAQELRGSNPFERAEGEVILRTLGATSVAGYSWYYFHRGDDDAFDGIFASNYPPAALLALQFLPEATGAGLAELVAWVAKPSYYAASQERQETDISPQEVDEAYLQVISRKTTRGERVLSQDVMELERAGRAKLEVEKLRQRYSALMSAITRTSSALAGFGQRMDLVEQMSAKATTRVGDDPVMLQGWIAETEPMVAEADAIIIRATANQRQLEEFTPPSLPLPNPDDASSTIAPPEEYEVGTCAFTGQKLRAWFVVRLVAARLSSEIPQFMVLRTLSRQEVDAEFSQATATLAQLKTEAKARAELRAAQQEAQALQDRLCQINLDHSTSIPKLTEQAWQLGHCTLPRDVDGLIEWNAEARGFVAKAEAAISLYQKRLPVDRRLQQLKEQLDSAEGFQEDENAARQLIGDLRRRFDDGEIEAVEAQLGAVQRAVDLACIPAWQQEDRQTRALAERFPDKGKRLSQTPGRSGTSREGSIPIGTGAARASEEVEPGYAECLQIAGDEERASNARRFAMAAARVAKRAGRQSAEEAALVILDAVYEAGGSLSHKKEGLSCGLPGLQQSGSTIGTGVLQLKDADAFACYLDAARAYLRGQVEDKKSKDAIKVRPAGREDRVDLNQVKLWGASPKVDKKPPKGG